MKIVIMILLLTSTTFADNVWRVKIESYANGELLSWPKNHCGDDVADHVRRIVTKYPYIELIDGKMSARIDEKRPVPAHSQVLGDVFSAFYDVTEERTIEFAIRWKDAKGSSVPIEVSVVDNKFCKETWLGVGRRI